MDNYVTTGTGFRQWSSQATIPTARVPIVCVTLYSGFELVNVPIPFRVGILALALSHKFPRVNYLIKKDIDSFVQDGSNSNALAIELL